MRFPAVFLAVLALNVFAAEQVFWNLDGSNIGNGKSSAWFGKNLRIEPAADGGFTLKSRAQHRVTFQPDSWLVFDLTKAEKQELNRYTGWSMSCNTKKYGYLTGSGPNVPLGLYTIQITGLESPMPATLTFYNYNLNLTFRFIKMVKNPENSVGAILPEGKTVLKPGDTFTIILKLKEPCEDVSCKLNQDRFPFLINGTSSVELKPVDKECKEWKAEITIRNYQSRRPVRMRGIQIKATVLGGKLNTPIYGVIPAAFTNQR